MQGLQTSNNFNSATGRAFRKFRKANEVSNNCKTDDWGEPDPLIDFSVEEILDMPTDRVLHSEDGEPKMDSEKRSQNSSNASRDDLELIDIESLFDEDTDDRPVLSEDEAWELFS